MKSSWDKIRIVNIYDVLNQMGYPNQCFDVTIKSLIANNDYLELL
jgi:hypothetical protein